MRFRQARLPPTPFGHAFRPRFPATPFGHAFQPRLPATSFSHAFRPRLPGHAFRPSLPTCHSDRGTSSLLASAMLPFYQRGVGKDDKLNGRLPQLSHKRRRAMCSGLIWKMLGPQPLVCGRASPVERTWGSSGGHRRDLWLVVLLRSLLFLLVKAPEMVLRSG